MTAEELVAALLDATGDAGRQALTAGQPPEVLRDSITLLKNQADKTSLSDLQAAAHLVDLIGKVADAAQDGYCWALANWARGNLLIQQGDFPVCLEAYRQAEQFFERTGSTTEVARLATNRAFTLKNLGLL